MIALRVERLTGVAGRIGRFLRGNYGMVSLAVLVVASVAFAVVAVWVKPVSGHRPNDAAGHEAVAAASQGTVALLTYAPDTLDRDFATAKSHLTGDFLNYYTQFSQQIVEPAAKDKAVRTSATVARAALSELHPDSAVVLEFINQTTTSSEKPDPTLAASSVRVTLVKADGGWRISSFDPL